MFVGLVVAGVLASGAAALLFLALADGIDKGCPSGLDGLGCGLVKIFGLIVRALILQTVVNYGVLRLFKIERASALAFLSTVAFVGWWLFFDNLISGGNVRPLPLLFPLALINALLYWLLRVLPPFRFQVFVLAVAVVISSWPLNDLGNRIDHRRHVRADNKAIAHANFATYEPVSLDGYTTGPLYYRPSYGGRDAPYTEWAARHVDDRLNEAFYTVRTFHTPEDFHPPENCGAAQPFDGSATPCHEAGRTTLDEPIYVDRGATFSNVQTFFVRRDTTLITIETGYPRGLTVERVAELVARLQPYRSSR